MKHSKTVAVQSVLLKLNKMIIRTSDHVIHMVLQWFGSFWGFLCLGCWFFFIVVVGLV